VVAWSSLAGACVEQPEQVFDSVLHVELELPRNREGEAIPYIPVSPALDQSSAQARIVLTANPEAAGATVEVLAGSGRFLGLAELAADERSGTIVLQGDGRADASAQFLFEGDAPAIVNVLVDVLGQSQAVMVEVLGPPIIVPSGAVSLPNNYSLQIIVTTPPSMQGRECLAYASRVTAAEVLTATGTNLFTTVVGDDAFTDGVLTLTLDKTTLLDPIPNVVTVECWDVYGQTAALDVTIEP
jgi:hypothetical protein